MALTVDGDKTNEQMWGLRARNVLFQTFQPNTGAQSRFQPLDEVLRKGTKTTNMGKIQELWTHHYAHSAEKCGHIFWRGRCMNKMVGLDCDVGMRRRKYTVLSGSIFAVWNRIEHILRGQEIYQAPKVIRLKTTDGSKIVGILVPDECVDDIIQDLRGDSLEIEESFYADK